MLQGRWVVGKWVQTGSFSQMREASPGGGGGKSVQQHMLGSHGWKASEARLGVIESLQPRGRCAAPKARSFMGTGHSRAWQSMGPWSKPQSPPTPLAPPPLTSLSENLCFWELDTQAEMGSAVWMNKMRGCHLQAK